MEPLIEQQEYLTAWASYLGACTVLIIIGWLWTRVIGNAYLRTVIRFVAIATLLLPIVHEDSNEILVPALVVVLLGAFIGNTVAAIKAMNILVGTCLTALVLGLVVARFITKRQRRRAAVSQADSQRKEPDVNSGDGAEGTLHTD